jgi:predicted dehydrogenase
MKTIKYGILGCGAHALRSHALPFKDCKEAKLVSICDISKEQLNNFEKNYGGKLEKFTDKTSFLLSGIDAVLIATPDEFHFKDLTTVLKSNLHVFVEKPVGITLNEVNRLPELFEYASDNTLIISSCHPRRYDPPFIWLKDNLQKLIAEMGKPLEFRFDFSYHKPSKEWKHHRGLLIDHLNHEVDLLHYLFGHAKFNASKLADSYDHYSVMGLREDGLRFAFSGTRRLESHRYLEWAEIRFDRGNLLLDAHTGKVYKNKHDDKSKTLKISPTDYAVRGRDSFLNFIRAINGKEKCYLTHDDLYVNTSSSVNLTDNSNWGYYGRDCKIR